MTFTVYGTPGTQGSHKLIRGRIVHDSASTMPWREAVAQAVMLAHPFGGRPDPILCRGPVRVSIMFVLRRSKSAKNGSYPATRPDIDKLTRSTLDALTQMGVFADDGRVVDLHCSKRYPGQDNSMAAPGAIISVEALTGAEERKAG